MRAIRRRQAGNIHADCFFRRVAKKLLFTLVPVRNGSIQVRTYNCFVGGFDNRGMPQECFLGPPALRDVDDHTDYACKLAVLVKKSPAMPFHPNYTLVRSDDAIDDLEERFLGAQRSHCGQESFSIIWMHSGDCLVARKRLCL